eukprot:5536969-Prymnesium_polylepis.1
MDDSDDDFGVAKNRCAACGEVNRPGHACANGVRKKMRRVPKTVREASLFKAPTGASAPGVSGKRKERTPEDDLFGSDSSEDEDCFIVKCVPPTKKAKQLPASTGNASNASDH